MSRTWAVLRVGLGLAQIMGATAAFYFLLTTGVKDLTLWATAVTLFFMVLSRLIFARLDRKK